MNNFLIFLYILLIHISVFAQFDEPEFFNRVNKNYYALELTDLNNFSCWITSNVFQETTSKFYKEEIFPLELIWVKPNDLYFISRSLPSFKDSIHSAVAQGAQTDLQNEIKALLMDWSRYYAGRLLTNMPSDYSIKSNSDSVYLEFSDQNDARNSITRLIFGQNGLVLQASVIYADSSEEILTHPEYKYTGEYWLCTGWRVQIIKKGQVDSGFHVKIISQRIGKYWIPGQFQLTLQSTDIKDKTFIRVYNFRNTRINRDIQILNRGN